MADAPVWPMHKWPHPTPGQGPLPNTELPQRIADTGITRVKSKKASVKHG